MLVPLKFSCRGIDVRLESFDNQYSSTWNSTRRHDEAIETMFVFSAARARWPVSVCRRQALTFLLAACGSILCIGCGSAEYERRLEETKKYFAYLDRVNTSLARPWDGSGFGVVVRVPNQFELLDAPEPELEEDGNERPILPQDDPRQPDHGTLPGLIGAWEWIVTAESEDEDELEEEENTSSCYIYLLGNHQMWLDRKNDAEIEPLEFFSIAEQAIADAFRLPVPTEDEDSPWKWEAERIPSKGGYQPQQDFDFVEFTEYEINNVTSSLIIYRHEANDIQIMLLILVPAEVLEGQNLSKRITYMLEWLKVSDATPSRHRPSAAEVGL